MERVRNLILIADHPDKMLSADMVNSLCLSNSLIQRAIDLRNHDPYSVESSSPTCEA